MRSFRSPAGRQSQGRIARSLAILIGLATLVGCAAPARIEVPAELPLRINDEIFTIEWALQQTPPVVRAAGRVTPSIDAEARVTLGFFGVDAAGRILSRNTTYLQSTFSRGPIAFDVAVTPTGRETRFEVRVITYSLSGARLN